MDTKLDRIKLDLSENIFGFSEKIKQTLIEEIQYINLYPDIECVELKRAISDYFKVGQGQIFVGNGLDEVILSLALSKKYDDVLIPKHSFMGYYYSAQIAEANIYSMELDHYKISLNSIYDKLDSIDAVFLCNPHNPFGTVLNSSDMENLVMRCEEKNVDVILDEAYMDFAESEKVHSAINLVDKYKNLYVLRTFSKAYSFAGLRCGFVISQEANLCDLQEIKKALPFNVNRLAQKAACCVLGDDILVKKNIELCKYSRDLFMSKLKSRNIPYIESFANFVTIYTEEADEVRKNLADDYRILVKDLKLMGLKNYLRIGIGTEEQMDYVLNTIDKLINK